MPATYQDYGPALGELSPGELLGIVVAGGLMAETMRTRWPVPEACHASAAPRGRTPGAA